MSGKGQVVIPKDVRDRLHLLPGDRLDVVERPDGVLLRRRQPRGTEGFDEITARIQSRIRYHGAAASAAGMDEAIAAMWAAGGPSWE